MTFYLAVRDAKGNLRVLCTVNVAEAAAIVLRYFKERL